MKKMFTTALCAMMAFMSINATSFRVATDGKADADGLTWANPLTIVAAMEKAVSGDELWLKAGTYTFTATLMYKEGVAIYGGFAGTETAVDKRVRANAATEPWNFTNVTEIHGAADGEKGFRLFDRPNKTEIWTKVTYFDGLKIAEKNLNRAIYGKEQLYVRNCIFVNSEHKASVLYFENGGTVEDCLFDSCVNPLYVRPVYAATAEIDKYQTITIKNCTFKNTIASPAINVYGTGADVVGYTAPAVEITGCKIIDNKYPFQNMAAGKFFNPCNIGHAVTDRPVNVSNCIFEGNEIADRGAIVFITGSGAVNFYNNIIRNNVIKKDASLDATSGNSAAVMTVYSKPAGLTLETGISIFNNLISNNTSNDRLVYAVQPFFFNNTVANNVVGAATSSLYFQLVPFVISNIFANNQLAGVDVPVLLDPIVAGSDPIIMYNALGKPLSVTSPSFDGNYELPAAGAGFTAPTAFVGAGDATAIAAANYTLGVSSPCLVSADLKALMVSFDISQDFMTNKYAKDLAGNARLAADGKGNAGAYQGAGASSINNAKADATFNAFAVANGIAIDSKEVGVASVFSVSGALVAKQAITEGYNTINLSTGFYIVTLNGAAVKVSVK